MLAEGAESTTDLLSQRVWGILATPDGREMLAKLCEFIKIPLDTGVGESAARIGVHRDTVRAWTRGKKMPYLARAVLETSGMQVSEGHKLMPLHLDAGGNVQTCWISVPTIIRGEADIAGILRQLTPTDSFYRRAKMFGMGDEDARSIRLDLFAYLLGMALGDWGKEGGEQERFTSANLDLILSKKHESNRDLGEFVCLCANSLGLEMDRIKDKGPSGDTLKAEHPWDSYRWTSERSPLIAWMLYVGLGVSKGQTTSNDPVHMDWIFGTSANFRKRFLQALADSDGTARVHVVEIVSTPNAEFVTRLLQSLGFKDARTRVEYGEPLRSILSSKDAASLPVFNEFVKSYRYRAIEGKTKD